MNEESGHVNIATRLDFHDALREAFKEIAQKGCREIFLCDENFADWPLSDAPVLEALTSWVFAHRRLVMVARHFDEMPRRHARFVEWRRTYAHVMECKALEDENTAMPCMLLAPPVVCVRLFDPLRYRGGVFHESRDLIRSRDLFDAVSQRSVESFPASILGL